MRERLNEIRDVFKSSWVKKEKVKMKIQQILKQLRELLRLIDAVSSVLTRIYYSRCLRTILNFSSDTWSLIWKMIGRSENVFLRKISRPNAWKWVKWAMIWILEIESESLEQLRIAQCTKPNHNFVYSESASSKTLALKRKSATIDRLEMSIDGEEKLQIEVIFSNSILRPLQCFLHYETFHSLHSHVSPKLLSRNFVFVTKDNFTINKTISKEELLPWWIHFKNRFFLSPSKLLVVAEKEKLFLSFFSLPTLKIFSLHLKVLQFNSFLSLVLRLSIVFV